MKFSAFYRLLLNHLQFSPNMFENKHFRWGAASSLSPHLDHRLKLLAESGNMRDVCSEGADATVYSVYSGSHVSVSAERDTSRMCRELSAELWDWAWKDRNNQLSMSCCLWFHARKTAGRKPNLHPTTHPCPACNASHLHTTRFHELIFSAHSTKEHIAFPVSEQQGEMGWGEGSATPLTASTYLNKAAPPSLQPRRCSTDSSLKQGPGEREQHAQDTWKSTSLPLGTI